MPKHCNNSKHVYVSNVGLYLNRDARLMQNILGACFDTQYKDISAGISSKETVVLHLNGAIVVECFCNHRWEDLWEYK